MSKKVFIPATGMLTFDPAQLMKTLDPNSKDFNV